MIDGGHGADAPLPTLRDGLQAQLQLRPCFDNYETGVTRQTIFFSFSASTFAAS